MKREIIAKQLIKIAKELLSENFGDYDKQNRFFLSKDEMKNLGQTFLKSEFFVKIKNMIDKKFQRKEYQDVAFFAKPLFTYLKSKEIEKIFKNFLKDQYKKNRKQQNKDGWTGIPPNADRDLGDFYKYGLYDYQLSDLRFPAIQKLMVEYVGNDWRKYIR